MTEQPRSLKYVLTLLSSRRADLYRLALQIGIWASFASLGYSLVLYYLVRQPIILGMAAGFAVAAALQLAARRALAASLERSGLFAGLSVVVSFLSGELFYSGLTLLNLLGGLATLGVVYFLVRPSRRRLWLALFFGFSILVLLANFAPPFPRVEPASLEGRNIARPYFATAIALIILIHILIQALRPVRVRGLRNRLLTTLLLASFIPVLLVAGLTGLFGFQTGRQQVSQRLEAVAALKEAQINIWLEDQRESSESILRPGIGARTMEDFLVGDPDRPTTITARARLVDEFNRLLANNDNFAEIFFADTAGQVRVATQTSRLGTSVAGAPFFRAGLIGYNVQAPVYSTTLRAPVSYISRPVFNTTSPRPGQQPLGVLIIRLDLDPINTLMIERAGLGQTGEAYLVSENYELLTPVTDSFDNPVGFTVVRSSGALRGGETRGRGSAVYVNYSGVPVIGVYRWVSSLHTLLLVEQAQEEIFAALQLNVLLNIGIAILAASAAVAAAFSLSQYISQPMVDLASEATRIAAGEIQRIETIAREDEIGTLSQALNQMTSRLQETVDNLESIVAERTRELEKRAGYLQAAAEVGKAATAIYRLDDLLTPVTHLVSERFGFYHVGIFLLDDTKEFAVLQATNSEGGWRMLARGHRLKVGEQGIVGYVTSTGQPRIQQHVGEDAIYYANPDLPFTRSELALPLRAAGELLGALDVQSVEETAFGEADVEVLQVLADQVALSIQNARLFDQLRQSIEAERRALGELSRSAWAEILRARTLEAVQSTPKGITPADPVWSAEARQALAAGELVRGDLSADRQRYPLAVPVRVRGNVVVGVLETYKPAGEGDWTTQELETLQAIAEQLGIALENARLFEQTQRLAQRERIAAEVSGKVWASSEVDTILQTAVQELGRALNASQGAIRLRMAGDSGNGHPADDANGGGAQP